MKKTAIGALIAGGAVLLTALPADAATIHWKVIKTFQSRTSTQVDAVAAVNSHDIWAFRDGGTLSALHFNGKSWTSVALPKEVKGPILGAGASPSGAVWALGNGAGNSSYALRWTGHAWSVAKRFPNSWPSVITVLSKSNVWVFGTQGGKVNWHFNGRTWTSSRTAAYINQVSALSATDMWAIGQQSNSAGDDIIAHFNGTSWTEVDPAPLFPKPTHSFSLTSIAPISDHDVWVVGSFLNKSILLHFNGTKWSPVSMPGGVFPNAMISDGHGGLWVVGNESDTSIQHRLASGTWLSSTVNLGTQGGILTGLTSIPGTSTVWASGIQMVARNRSEGVLVSIH